MSIVNASQSNVVATLPSGMPLDIGARLAPAGPDEVKTAIKALAVAFNAEISSERAMVYYEAISGEPIWAVNRTAKEFRTGSAPSQRNRAFMPTPAELGARVREITAPHRDIAAPTIASPSEPAFTKQGTEESRALTAGEILKKHGFGHIANNYYRENEGAGG